MPIPCRLPAGPHVLRFCCSVSASASSSSMGVFHQIGPPYFPSPLAQLTQPVWTSGVTRCWAARNRSGTLQNSSTHQNIFNHYVHGLFVPALSDTKLRRAVRLLTCLFCSLQTYNGRTCNGWWCQSCDCPFELLAWSTRSHTQASSIWLSTARLLSSLYKANQTVTSGMQKRSGL